MLELDDLKEALAAVQVGVWWWDIASNALRWSDELCVLFGLEPGSTPESFDDYIALISPDERPGVRNVLENALRTATETASSTSYVVEHRIGTPDGGTRWIEGRGRVVVDRGGKPARVVGTGIDVTARKQTEELLRKAELVRQLISELSSDYVYIADVEGPTLVPEVVGGSFERTTGMTPADVAARGGWWKVIHPEDAIALDAVVAGLLEGKPSIVEYRITDAAGQIRWLRDSIRPVADASGTKIVKLMGGVQDITERKHLERQLLQAQKLEAVARLSGGIAHDFNNLLSVVMGSVALLEVEEISEQAKQSCDMIMEAASRGAELTRSLLVFARREGGTPQLVDLGEVVREAVPMLARAVGTGVVVELVEPPAACLVHIDRGQMQLLLLNLSVNARDAMPRGGTLRFSMLRSTYGAADGIPAELPPGDYVRLSVADEGEGIQPEVMARLFEPFFTTKQPGKGTGLGLAACHGVVQSAAGAIAVDSVAGKGATFHIYLPAAAPGEAARPSREIRASKGGTERILLVEDEPQLLRLVQRALSGLGYTVLAVESAELAIDLLQGASFDLVISDVVLAGLRGTALAATVQTRWPRTPVLLVSGYPGAEGAPAGVPFLGKPFTMDRLANRVREILDRQDASLPDDVP